MTPRRRAAITFRQQNALVVEDAVHPRRIHVGDDVAALEQRKNSAQRRVILADMNHDRKIKGGGRFLGTAQRLEVVGAGDVVGQPRLDADDNVTVARDGSLRQSHAGGVDVVQFAGGRDDAGARDVTRQRPSCGAPRATAAMASILSAPPVPASTQAVTPSCRHIGGPSLLRPAWV